MDDNCGKAEKEKDGREEGSWELRQQSSRKERGSKNEKRLRQ
jgi:hypothetical protein